jgi:hypothetical protein
MMLNFQKKILWLGWVQKKKFLCELFFVGVIALLPDFLIIFRYDANAFPRMGPIFQQPMRRVRHDLMGHFNFLALRYLRQKRVHKGIRFF